MSAVWAALKADANDLRKQQRILRAFRTAAASLRKGEAG
jgi:type IV secretory pathway TrbL component